MANILLVTNIPTPYRIPLFNEIHRQMRDRGHQFKVVFAALGYSRRKWNMDMGECAFPYMVLPPSRLPSRHPEHVFFTYRGLGRVLAKERPDLIITGGFGVATLKLFFRSFLGGPAYVIWSGAILSRGLRDSWLRKTMRSRLVRRAGGGIAYGTRAKEYLISLGARRHQVCLGTNTVDTHFFVDAVDECRRRIQDDAPVKRLLYVGHLTPGKRLDLLLRAAAKLAESRDDFEVQIVGSGPEEENLRALSRELGIARRVRFEGFRQKPELPAFLAGAYCFVFPSEYDVWGLVLVEAMAAGLCCLASIHSGATCDVVKDGVTGYALDFEQTEKVVACLQALLDQPERCREMGRAAQEFVETNLTVVCSARGFMEAAEIVLDNGKN